MSAITQTELQRPQAKIRSTSSFLRVLKYSAVRLVSLLVSVVIAIFLTILIANMGGYVDQIRMGEIRETVVQAARGNQANRTLPPEQFQALINDLVYQEAHAQGLDRPFVVRTVEYMKKALTLDLGNALRMTSDTGSKQVRLIILERLPPTLLLMGTSQLALFFSSVFFALTLSRR
jgi:peptide/nickel transport system permease protein